MAIRQSAEDYLETILVLQQRLGQVRSIDIVNELGYSKPSISIAMKKLRESGHVLMAGDGTLTLTDSGLSIAQQVYDRHTVIANLFRLLGVPEDIAAEDACKVEHHLSDETFRCIREFTENAKNN